MPAPRRLPRWPPRWPPRDYGRLAGCQRGAGSGRRRARRRRRLHGADDAQIRCGRRLSAQQHGNRDGQQRQQACGQHQALPIPEPATQHRRRRSLWREGDQHPFATLRTLDRGRGQPAFIRPTPARRQIAVDLDAPLRPVVGALDAVDPMAGGEVGRGRHRDAVDETLAKRRQAGGACSAAQAQQQPAPARRLHARLRLQERQPDQPDAMDRPRVQAQRQRMPALPGKHGLGELIKAGSVHGGAMVASAGTGQWAPWRLIPCTTSSRSAAATGCACS